MRGGRGGRVPNSRSVAPTPARKGYAAAASRRESDVSLCSNRPSSVSLSHASAALRSVNAYLSSLSTATLRPPLPSARDITKAFDDVLSRLDWPMPVGVASTLEDDLPSILSNLRCPVKLSKSALKAREHLTPRFRDYRSSSQSFAEGNNVLQYHFQSFALFMEGDDEAVKALDQEQFRQTEEHVAKLMATTTEKERALLKDDIKKFDVMIESWKEKLLSAEKLLGEKEEGLDAKIRENQRISEENEELRKRIGSQVMNVRDAERTKKELQAMERDVAEAEIGRNVLEEKSWELEADIDRKLKELESLAEGSSAAEVLGEDYKTVLKPFLNEAADETKKSSVAKLEEKIYLQQQSREKSILLDERKELLSILQKKIDEEVDDHTSRCSAEAERMMKDRESREHQLLIMEEEAENFLKDSELKLQKSIRESDEEIQMCASELVALIDAVSEYKECMESLVGEIQADLSETTQAIVDAHKVFLSARLMSAGQSASLCGSKRAHALLTS
ncbi:unnamed protein product [Spirodela intermedia]|uniref:Uncharacterized protein n=1 Tax=Spirodela intermedia TaxID=51605 RepID=A0A7I8IN70_SPIIN|nr:unnamed protein product [Spirodela intermedia]CAA6658902.1 unnamed protein product [Spirodela intermedia]